MHPFEGLKVLDFCWVVIGPMTTRYFSDYGATVVRVESEHRPDVIRHGVPFAGGLPGMNRSAYWTNYNTSKLGLALNLADPRAKEIAFKLATEWADVITENFTPGTMARLGLGYEAIAAKNPGVVMMSASMLGEGGPHGAQPGFGPVLTALSGHTWFTGWPDRVPVSPYGAYTDFLVPHLAMAALVAAMDHSKRTGQGQHIDLSQLESSLYYVAPPLLEYAANGTVSGRDGNHDPAMAPHNAYPCTGDDRWCAIACQDDGQWRALAGLMGQPGLVDDPRFATLDARKANEDALDALVGEWTAGLDAHELMARCQQTGIAAGVVNDCADLFTDPQLSHRGHIQFMDHPEMGRYASDISAFTLSDGEPVYRPAPMLGQHTDQVLHDALGMPQPEIDALRADGVLE